MADTGTIQEHSLFGSFYQAEDNLYFNCVIDKNTDRKILPIVTSLVGRIYAATKAMPVKGTMLALRNGSAVYEAVSLSYTLFVDDSVLVTVGIKVL